MPTTGPQKPKFPKHWKKQHLGIYRDLQSVKNVGEILRTLVKYQQLKNDGATNLPQELIDAHIEVTRYILEAEKGISKTRLDEYLKRNIKNHP